MFDTALSAQCADVVSPWETTGRLIAVELWCDRPRRSLDFDSLRGAPPYADVPHRTWCVFCRTLKIFESVGADIIRPPTLQIFEQNRFGPTGVPMLPNAPCFDIVPSNFAVSCSTPHCRRNAPTLFPHWVNNRAANSRPYADVPHRNGVYFAERSKFLSP